MQKTKLIQLIQKNLEELKEIAEEIIHHPGIDKKEVDLAISKAKTLQIELEILREKQTEITLSEDKKSDELINENHEVVENKIPVSEDSSLNINTDTSTDSVIHSEKPKTEIPYLNRNSIGEIVEKFKTADRKASKPIHNLRTEIGINDRYYFVRELFENNVDRFISVVEDLDKLENINQAIDYIDSIRLKKTESSQQFIELVKRRFTN